MIETVITEPHTSLHRATLAAIWRDSANILVAFALGVVATLAYLGLTGGFYEYRVADEKQYPSLIGNDGWTIDREYHAIQGGPVYQVILKRSRIHLP